VLYNFCPQTGCPDGSGPTGTPILDAHGNIYGVTGGGGANNDGVVYEMTPNGGTWSESVLYSFCSQSNCADGNQPHYPLVFDSQGNLYGTTVNGGTYNGGVVYELSPPPGGNGPWTETVLYNICTTSTCSAGSVFVGGLIIDSHGNLYGTASEGGTHSEGLVYELSPNGGGSWTFTAIYNFCPQLGCPDGSGPQGSLIFDAQGNLYGTTTGGGANQAGTVFELSPGSGGSWTETVLYSFCPVSGCPDGNAPQHNLVFDAQGDLYGTVLGGGANAYGGVFQLSPSGGGSWTEQLIASFCPGPNCTNGYDPMGLATDGHNVFGVTAFGGGTANRGTVFELKFSGQWIYNVLFAFCPSNDCTDYGGGEPEAGAVLDAQGNIYGSTGSGALHSFGAVYELSPHLISTSTVLTTAPNPAYYLENVTMTATVTAQDGSIPTGSVIFSDNGVPLIEAGLSNGVVQINIAGFPVGTNALVAAYQGGNGYAPSTSNTVQQVITSATTTTAVTSTPNPSISGESVTITATVSPSGPPPPTGTVSFSSNGTAIAGCTAVTLSSATAQCVTAALPTGTDNIVAAYSGDSNFAASSGMLTQFVNPVPNPLQLFTVMPCRLVDTRGPDGPFGGPSMQGNTSRSFPLPQNTNCNVPDSAVAYSLNVTVAPQQPLGYLTIWPTGEGQPVVSTMNSPDGRVKANAAIVPAGTSGAVSVYVTNTTDVIIDIDGYFAPPGTNSLQFYTLTPCRVIDTRTADGDLGGPYLMAQMERDFPVLESSCLNGVNGALAYSMNFTVVPHPAGQPLGYLSVWPQGQMQPVVSTLNNPTATVVANAAIVPAGTNGGIATFAYNSTDLIVDINGYFAAPANGGVSFYAVAPCRAFDSRANNGQPFTGQITVPISSSPCAPPANAAGYVFNATVVPTSSLGYLTLWPDGETQPVVSTLNAYDGFVTSNMAVVPNMNGSTDAYAGIGDPGPGSGYTQLILDISGYFAP
jgi:uncharacterized repeat protein (TIGR03803 family)